MPNLDTSKLRVGTRVELNEGEPFIITQYQHVKPGKGGAFIRLKLKSLVSGAVLDRTLKGGESLPQADVESRDMQYLYRDGSNLVFMDQQSYEQIEITSELIENDDLLEENCDCVVLLHRGKPIGVDPPNFVVLEVVETDPSAKGARLKPARLSTGASIQIPSFIDRGEKVKVDTRDRSYVERA